jgi:hypothetical protein
METFLSIHQDAIIGTLSTFDCMIFKGHLTKLFPSGAQTAARPVRRFALDSKLVEGLGCCNQISAPGPSVLH